MVTTHYRIVTSVLVCGLILAATGCQSVGQKMGKYNPVAMFKDKEEPAKTPGRVVAAWSEAVLHQDGKATRGFGGRLYFYERGSQDPCRVEGQLVVYAFDENVPDELKEQYQKRYIFPAEQLARHESPSEIGASYSVWLPWDEVGGDQAEVSLIARFEPLQGGGLVVSDPARQFLPGKAHKTMIAKKSAPASKIEQTGYTSTVDEKAAAAPKLQMKTTTISLPNKFRRTTTVTDENGTSTVALPQDSTTTTR